MHDLAWTGESPPLRCKCDTATDPFVKQSRVALIPRMCSIYATIEQYISGLGRVTKPAGCGVAVSRARISLPVCTAYPTLLRQTSGQHRQGLEWASRTYAHQTRRHRRRLPLHRGIRWPFRLRSKPASRSCWSTTTAVCGRAAPASSRWTGTASRWPGAAKRRSRWSSAGSSTSSWSTCTCRRSRDWNCCGPRSTSNRDTIVVVMTGQSERHDEHRGAAGRRLGLPPEAVLRDPPPGADRSRLARRHGQSRGLGSPAPGPGSSRPRAKAAGLRSSASRRSSARRSSCPARSPRPTPRCSSPANRAPARK